MQANGTADQASAALNAAPAAPDAAPAVLGLLDDLRGRNAVVTGAARGIGEAIAKWLIMAGADVTVIDRDSRVKDVFRTESCQVMEADLYDEDVVALADELTTQRPVELLVLAGNGTRTARTRQVTQVTQGELASMVSGARQTVNQALHSLETRGYIRADGRSFEILDRERLERLAER